MATLSIFELLLWFTWSTDSYVCSIRLHLLRASKIKNDPFLRWLCHGVCTTDQCLKISFLAIDTNFCLRRVFYSGLQLNILFRMSPRSIEASMALLAALRCSNITRHIKPLTVILLHRLGLCLVPSRRSLKLGFRNANSTWVYLARCSFEVFIVCANFRCLAGILIFVLQFLSHTSDQKFLNFWPEDLLLTQESSSSDIRQVR